MWWIAVASAQSGAPDQSSTCAPLEVTGALPEDGTIVPPDVVGVVTFDGQCGEVWVELVDETEAEVLLPRMEFHAGFVVVAAEEYLHDGPWTVRTYTYGYPTDLATWIVQAGATQPAPSAPLGLTLTAERRCGEVLETVAAAEVTFAEPNEGFGILSVIFETEFGTQSAQEQVWSGESTVVVQESMLGGRSLCATATMTAVDGLFSASTERVCAEEFTCPPEERPVGDGDEEAGCGCQSSRGPTWGLALPLLVLARRRAGRTAHRRG